MIDVTLHLRGGGSDRRQLPALPGVGSYVYDQTPAGRVWQVSAVVFCGAEVAVYCTQLSMPLAAELTAAWSQWANQVAT